jgi:hypothetical protein
MTLIDGDDTAGGAGYMVQELFCYMNGNAERGKIGRASAPQIMQSPMRDRTPTVEGGLGL